MTTSESKGRFFYKTNRFESIRIANWNALVSSMEYVSYYDNLHLLQTADCIMTSIMADAR